MAPIPTEKHNVVLLGNEGIEAVIGYVGTPASSTHTSKETPFSDPTIVYGVNTLSDTSVKPAVTPVGHIVDPKYPDGYF